MQNTVNHYIQKWKIGRKHRREIGWVICILSVVVAGGVFWQLRMTGNTLNGEASCGKSEHTHSEKCLERRLICGLEEDTADVSGGENADGEDIPVQQRHVHTDACYENVYICGKEEHIHTLSCYADLNADVETASDWERTLPETLAGKKAEDLAAVAKSQIGYKESEKNFVIAEDGETVRNYTRYGQWYGNSHGEWNAMFAAFCLNYAGIGKDEIPYNSGCYAWTVQLEKEGLLRWPDEYVPYAGDLIFFDRDADGAADHVGIISDIKVQDTQTVLEVIEGNESVECREYTMQDSSIAAYVRISEEEEEQDVPKEDVSEEDVSKEENGLLTIPVTVYEDEIYTVLREGAEQITVSGYLPEGASAKAYPVEAMIAEQKVLWAYDIAVFDENGGQWEPFEQKLRVHVQMMEKDTAEATPEEDVPEENAGILVYYLPEEGEAESIPSQTDVDGVSFEAEHFSVYAAVAARGTGVEDEAALKKAFTDGSTEIQLTADFNVTGPIAVTTGEHTLDLNGHKLTVQGAASLFQVSGGSLKIIDSQAGNGTETFTYSVTETAVTDTATGATTETLKTYTVPIAGKIVGGSGSVVRVNGGSFKLESGALCNGTGRAVDMSGGTAELAGGYIFGFTKTGEINTGDQYFGGAILASGGELEISGTVLAGNKALNGGAVYAKNCKVTISGGVLSSNESVREFEGWDNHSENAPYRCGGGAVYCDGATELRMSGGYITNNKVIHNGYFDGGGGILISGTTEFTMDGGYITGNEASGGGGVRSDWNKSTSFIMEGGFISGNTAREAEGGGVAITQGGKGSINGGYITNNKITKTVHWGGGGLFCSDGAYLQIYNTLVTNNHADGFGGGVAGCSTGRVYICVKDGGAVYDNTAYDENVEGSIEDHLSGKGSEKNEDQYAASSPVFMENGYKDYFCALNSLVEGGMLGGGTANWSGSMDGVAISNVPKDAILEAAYVMGLTSDPSGTDKANARNEAKVFINGNSSYTHGGGILCNGYLLVGDKNPIAVGSRLTLSAKKALIGGNLADYKFTFNVTDENGNVVSIGTNNKDGNISFDRLLSFTEEMCKEKIKVNGGTADFYYKLSEQPDAPEIIIDKTIYRIKVTIRREDETLPFNDVDGSQIVKSYYKIEGVIVEKSTDEGKTWVNATCDYKPSANEQHGGSLAITNNSAAFTNKVTETIPFTVIKKWAGGDNQISSVTVDLMQDGVVIDTITLSGENNWTYTWEKLPKGSAYTVYEHPVQGYETEYITGIVDEKPAGGYRVDTIEEGGIYLLVSKDGFALKGTPDQYGGAYKFGAENWIEVNVQDGYIVPDYITEEMQWDAVGISGKPGLYLKNRPSDGKHYLSYQNSDTVQVSSDNTGFASQVKGCNSGLRLAHKDNNNNTVRYVVKEGDNAKASESNDNALYAYRLSGSGEQNVITIVNTRTEEPFYDLELTKTDANDNTKKLSGAVFQLFESGTPDKTLTFRLDEETGKYMYTPDGETTDLVTDLTTGEDGMLHVGGLPEGTYLLHEKQAPEGYEVTANDQTLTLPDDIKNGENILKITVEDERITYHLPATGGVGQGLFTVAGMLMIAAAFLGGWTLRRKYQKM